MPLATGKLEDFLWTTKACSNFNSSYNYIKNICFELFIFSIHPSAVHENGMFNRSGSKYMLSKQSWCANFNGNAFTNFRKYLHFSAKKMCLLKTFDVLRLNFEFSQYILNIKSPNKFKNYWKKWKCYCTNNDLLQTNRRSHS
jgi:hypothetical protein